ncbi:MAG: flagellar basal body P-ring formation chaperone FlgA [Methylomonas sp.]
MRTIKFSAWLLLANSCLAGEFQDVRAIQSAVKDYAYAALNPDGRYQIEVMPLDARLQLPFCGQTLEISPQNGEIKAGRNTVQVQCANPAWKIYSSVTVKSYKDVLVLAKPIRRDDVIHAEDIVTESREISTLTQGYLLDAADAVNKQAARNLLPGAVLNPSSYRIAALIKRGDRVSIQLAKAGVTISMAGIALTNGVKGERINVRNISSQKLIQAVVLDSAQVQVNF